MLKHLDKDLRVGQKKPVKNVQEYTSLEKQTLRATKCGAINAIFKNVYKLLNKQKLEPVENEMRNLFLQSSDRTKLPGLREIATKVGCFGLEKVVMNIVLPLLKLQIKYNFYPNKV